ncbi:MAG: carboxymuconolactone decarboxylase family protein [Planctomycetota bacterium JB042]
MSRIEPVDPNVADAKTRTLLDAVRSKLGAVPNMTRTMARSPAVLDAYLAFSGALAKTSLSAAVRERLALAVGEVNGCDYCLSAHSAIGRKVGLSQEEVDAARLGRAGDPKTTALLAFARELVLRRGELKDADLRAVREAGATDAEVVEVVAVAALNVFTNWFNHVTDPEIDFPIVRAGDGVSAAAAAGSER